MEWNLFQIRIRTISLLKDKNIWNEYKTLPIEFKSIEMLWIKYWIENEKERATKKYVPSTSICETMNGNKSALFFFYLLMHALMV